MAAVLLLAAGCPRRAPGEVDDPLPGLLRRADAAWAARGTDGFEPVEEALGEARQVAPDHPEVQWRYVRLEVGRGLASDVPAQAVRHFSKGRSFGITCLAAAPGFLTAQATGDWAEAVREVPANRQACLGWTAFAWARWLAAHGGAAGAVDLDAIDRLVRRQASGRSTWTEGIVAAARPPELGRDLEAARDALQGAVEEDPGDLARRADLVFLVGLPADDADLVRREVEAILDAEPDTPEDRRAVERVRRLGEAPVEAPGKVQEVPVPE